MTATHVQATQRHVGLTSQNSRLLHQMISVMNVPIYDNQTLGQQLATHGQNLNNLQQQTNCAHKNSKPGNLRKAFDTMKKHARQADAHTDTTDQ